MLSCQGGFQAILLALDAILGHRSAHSLATGPVIALPVNKNNNIASIIYTFHLELMSPMPKMFAKWY